MLQDSHEQISTLGWSIAELAVGTLFLVLIMLVHGSGFAPSAAGSPGSGSR